MVSVTLLEFAVCSSDVNKPADDSSSSIGCAAVPATPTQDASTELVASAAPVENTTQQNSSENSSNGGVA